MTERRGGSYYDDPELLGAYLEHRHAAVTSPNLVMEDPAFTAEVGRLDGLRVLDLGCGDGAWGRACIAGGAASYLGIDGSRGMVDRAIAAADTNTTTTFEVADMEDFEPMPASVDLVTSRMALHYIAHVDPVFRRARSALVPGGRLVASMLHPVISAGNQPSDGPRQTQLVDDYFNVGDRTRDWFGSDVTWVHRTIEQTIDAIVDAGFAIERIRECEPVEALFAGDTAEYERRKRVPLFLLVSATAVER